VVLAGVALVSAALGGVSYVESSHALLEASQSHLLALAQSQAGALALRLEKVAAVPWTLRTVLSEKGKVNQAKLLAVLRKNLAQNKNIYGMAMACAPYSCDPQKKLFAPYIYRTPQGLKISHLDSKKYDYPLQNWYLIPSQTALPSWSEPYYDEGGGHTIMTTYSAPVVVRGEVKAIITADVDLKVLAKMVRRVAPGQEGHAFIISARGTFLEGPKKEWILSQSIFSLAETWQRPELRDLGRRMIRGVSGVLRFKDMVKGRSSWLAFAPIKGPGWTFAVVAPEKQVLKPVVDLTKHLVFWAAIGLGAMVVVILLMVLSLTSPMQKLAAGARRLAKGDYNTRVHDVRPGDEIGDLADTFNTMAQDITEYVHQLEETNQSLAASLKRVELLENIETHMSKFVPESVKRLIETAPENPDLEKREHDVSVLFLDIAGYTRMSESVSSQDMNFLIERYFSSFLDEIYKNKGDINETAGDGLMIIFQDSDPQKHAEHAVKTALSIQETVQRVNKDLAGRFQPVVVNIGINSGLAMVGSSRFEGVAGTRWTFTASGPVTNVAARIGAQATEGAILIGPETAKRVSGKFNLTSRGKKYLKNVKEPVEIFEVLA
jgi:class 3 adenylate cyclase/HAMP domain-containing protein